MQDSPINQQKQTPPKDEWTEPEKWVWEKTCQGEIADFNFKYNKNLDPRKEEDWTEERLISTKFLEAILFDDAYCKILPRNGVMVSGARIKERLDFRNAKINLELQLINCRFESDVDLTHLHCINAISLKGSAFLGSLIFSYAKVGSYINLIGTKVAGELNMDTLSVGSSLFMREGCEFNEVILIGAKINGTLEISGSKVTSKLDMNSIYVSSSLFMKELAGFDAEFNEVIMIGAKIEDTLEINGINITGLLNISSLSVGGHVFMQNADFNNIIMRNVNINGQHNITNVKVSGNIEMSSLIIGDSLNIRGNSEFNYISIIGAEINGQLDITGPKFMGNIYIDSITVQKNVFLRAEIFKDLFSFILSVVNGSVYISDAEIFQLDLGGTSIRGELHIGSIGRNLKWKQNSFLSLRNTEVGAIMDAGEDSWPDELNLDGFTYSRLGGLFGHDVPLGKQIAERESKWFVDWMAKDKSYSPQPYSQLAGILSKMGYPEKANAVLYAAKNREKDDAKNSKLWLRWFGLSTLKWTIGYGFGGRYFRSLIWVLCLTVLGVLVLNTLNNSSVPNVWDKIGYSVDMLLPIISLDERYKLDFSGWQLYYFYFHKLMGFLLGSFVVAGLSGITKR